MTLQASAPPPAATPPVPETDVRTPSFWIALVLLALLACLLIYGIFETRFRIAVEGGTAAVDLLRRNARRLWILIAGTGLILLGIIISPLPGPGFILLAPVGMGILATEFAWARRLKQEIQRRASPLENATKHVADRTPRWIVVPALLLYWCIPAALASFTSLPQPAIWSVASVLFAPFIFWALMVFRTSAAPKPGPQSAGDAGSPAGK
ncbi:MAG: PGPGW domain-containing protein [Phycisphaerae bacterium]|nr:PGPGW domain-containing protein [Phycisphaerae bacterium]